VKAAQSGFPRFHKKGVRDSARLYEVTLEERHIRLPMIGRVGLKETRTSHGFEGRILSATISRRADRWFVSLAVERERTIVLPKTVQGGRDVVGIDLGLKSAAVIYDGETTRTIPAQRAYRNNPKKLRRLDRQLARKQKARPIGGRQSWPVPGSTTGSPASAAISSTSSPAN
jgi:putative transposase